jgi:subtilisin family serine protease
MRTALAFLFLILAAPAWAQVDVKADPRAADQLNALADATGEVPVIATLAAPDANDRPGGWVNLGDYIAELQLRAIQDLGWTNINQLVRYENSPAMAMRVSAERLRRLVASRRIVGVYVDEYRRPGLTNSRHLIGGDVGPAAQADGSGQAVAVLDTGVDADHPFLQGQVIAEACFSSSIEGKGQRLITACANGESEMVGAGAGRPCPDAYDCDHGTHVAGIVAGRARQLSGIAAGAKVVAVQVFSKFESPRCGKTGKCAVARDSDVIRALEWVFQQRERIPIAAVNMSLGGGRYREACNSPYRFILRNLAQANIAVVVASGNESYTDSIASPACIPEAISIGATDKADAVTGFSNSAAILDLLAPGGEIVSSVTHGRFAPLSGTSMAAPHVAAAFAVLRGARPDADLPALLSALRETGKPVRDGRNGLTRPRIQLDRALAALAGAPSKPQPQPETPRQPTPPPQAQTPAPPPPQAEAPKPEPPREQNVGGIRVIDKRDDKKSDKIKW